MIFLSQKITSLVLVLLVVVGLQSCYKEAIVFDSEPTKDLQLPLILKFDNTNCAFDATLNLLRYSLPSDSISNFQPLVEFQEFSEIKIEGQNLSNNTINNLGTIYINKKYKIQITTNGTEKDFHLVFTNLPIIQIINDSKIYDEPKSLARIIINNTTNYSSFSSYAGIEYRGKSSRSFDKKSMGFSLWKKMVSSEKYSSPLLGMKTNSEWILTSAFNDPSRIRNMVSFKIWNDLNTDEGTKTKHHSIKSQPVELFINRSFQGLYIFSETINEELLDTEGNTVLYKAIDWSEGATKFETFNPELSQNLYWNGWEQKIPNPKETINWNPLFDLYNLVINGSDNLFCETISSKINLDVFIDYYLFLNLTMAADNTGKNNFLYKNIPDTPFQIIPWDLDGTWGIQYDGLQMGFESVLSNNLFNRLFKLNPENFKLRVKSRWFNLRLNSFSKNNLTTVFEKQFQLLTTSDVIEMENTIWQLELNLQEEQNYINRWLSNRLIFLDKYFETY